MNSRAKSFTGLTAAAAISMLGVGIVMSSLPERVIELNGGSSALVGLLASCYGLPYIIFQVPFGSLSDRFGVKLFLLFGYFLMALSGLLFYFAASSLPIFMGRALQGAGEIPLWAMASALIAIAYPEHKEKMLGIYSASMYVGLAAGPLLRVIFPSVLMVGELGFMLYSILCVLSFFIILVMVENNKKGSLDTANRLEIRKAFALLSDLPVRITLFGIFLYGCGQGLVFAIAPAWFITEKGFSLIETGMIFTASYVFIFLLQITYGTLSDRYGRRPFIIAGLLLTALSWGIFPYIPRVSSIICVGFAAGSLGGFYVASMAFLNERAPDHLKGTISGAYYFFWGIGYFLGPLLWSFGGRRFGMTEGFMVFSLLLALTAAALLFTGNAGTAPPASSFRER